MGLKLVKNQRDKFRLGDAVRILGTGLRGLGKVVKGLGVGIKWMVVVFRSLWSVIRWIGKFGMGVVNLGRGINKMLRVTSYSVAS
ncbi:MAG TPA: hypothetical protein VHY08_12405 [Bacillota bacterium]|nr:hypothetical protein [Bacillota bacterium]